MRSFLCLDFLICFAVINSLFFGCTEADMEQGKIRRGAGTSGLIAFPRVGRSDPNLWSNLHDAAETQALENIVYANSMEDYEEFPKTNVKRASLIAFPRVGRTSDSEFRKLAHMLALQQALDKRTGPSATSGLWFGPRLGKRSVDAIEKQNNSEDQKEKV